MSTARERELMKLQSQYAGKYVMHVPGRSISGWEAGSREGVHYRCKQIVNCPHYNNGAICDMNNTYRDECRGWMIIIDNHLIDVPRQYWCLPRFMSPTDVARFEARLEKLGVKNLRNNSAKSLAEVNSNYRTRLHRVLGDEDDT